MYIDDGSGDDPSNADLTVEMDGQEYSAPDTVGTDHDGVAGDLYVDTGYGEVDAGPATVDSDSDGDPDTAVTHTDDGSTVLYTDTDDDGEADIATVITPDGETDTLQHTADDEWTPVTGAEDPASDRFWGQAVGSQLIAGVVRIDAGTGQWISPN